MNDGTHVREKGEKTDLERPFAPNFPFVTARPAVRREPPSPIHPAR